MKKWLVIGALTLGMVGASGQTTIQAAQQSPTASVFEKIANVEQQSLGFFDLYNVFKIAELDTPSIKAAMNSKQTAFTVQMPLEILMESEEGSENYLAEYTELQTYFGKAFQLKLTKHGQTFKAEILAAGEWLPLSKEEQAEFLAGFFSTGMELRPGGHFKDIIGHWAEGYIQVLYQGEIVSGTTETTFSPNGKVTRGQLVAMIYRATSTEIGEQRATSYTDLTNFWGAKEVTALESQGVLSIFTGENFEPNKAVTREEMAFVTAKYLALEGLDIAAMNTRNTFKDVDNMNAQTITAIGLLQQLEIIGGENGQFNPKGNLTRAQFAKIFTLSLMVFE